MTARPEELAIEGLRLLRAHGIELAGAAFGVSDKPALCDALGIRVLVDDDPGVLRAAHANGLSVVAPRRAHNRRVIDELGLPAASSWQRLHHLIAHTVAEHLAAAARPRAMMTEQRRLGH